MMSATQRAAVEQIDAQLALVAELESELTRFLERARKSRAELEGRRRAIESGKASELTESITR